MSTLGAVVVTYRTTTQQLQRCLHSLGEQPIARTVVVDNEQSPAIEAECTQQHVQYVAQPNRGFGAGCNAGAAELATDYLLFVNPDAQLKPGAALTVIEFLNRHPQAAIVGLQITAPTGQPEQDSFGAAVTLASLLHRKAATPPVPTVATTVGWVSGAALVIRRSVFEQVGGFDPNFFLYWEDVDLCRRVAALHWQIYLLPNAEAIHQRGASEANQQRKTQLYDQSADRYFRKHYPDTIWVTQRLLRSLYRHYSPRVR